MQTFNVVWSKDAYYDLDAIIGYIYQESQTNAKEIYLALKALALDLSQFPYRGRVVPELETLGFTLYRELIYKRWRIIYSVEKSKVYILLIIDSRQDIQVQLVHRILHYEE